MTDTVRELFDNPDRLAQSSKEYTLWVCDDCDVQVPVRSHDPYYPSTVLCPECGDECEQEVLDW